MPKFHSKDDIIYIRKLRNAGWSMARIAAHLKLTKGQVAGVVWRNINIRRV